MTGTSSQTAGAAPSQLRPDTAGCLRMSSTWVVSTLWRLPAAMRSKHMGW